jgi:hypothetical protein
MLYFCVNRPSQSANPCSCGTSEKPPANSFSCHTSRTRDLESFLCHTSEKALGGTLLRHPYPLTDQTRTFPSARTLFTLLSLLIQRVIHISFAFKRFRTLSQKCRVSWVQQAKFLKGTLEVASHFGTRRLLLPSSPPMVLSLSLCDNVALPSQQEPRLT